MTMEPRWSPMDLKKHVLLYSDKFHREDCKHYSVHFSGAGDSPLWLTVSDNQDYVESIYRLDGWHNERSLRITTTRGRSASRDGGDELSGAEGSLREARRAPPPGVTVTIESDFKAVHFKVGLQSGLRASQCTAVHQLQNLTYVSVIRARMQV